MGFESGSNGEKRGLAAARRSNQCHELVLINGKIDVFERHRFAASGAVCLA
jgi:hypothetical protein